MADAHIRIKMLDLFCGDGGAAMGYHRSGFEIIGIDKEPQPRYPFKFIQADAIPYLINNHKEFDVVHASPPCQRWSCAGRGVTAITGIKYPDLIRPLKSYLIHIGIPYVIENVPFAPIRPDLKLYGYAFGLPIIRQRWFELGNGIWLMNPFMPENRKQVSRGELVTVAGSGSRLNRKRKGKEMVYDKEFIHWKGSVRATWAFAMGIEWMGSIKELAQAIPPAYTEYIGHQIYSQLKHIKNGN